ncbi:bifunctional tRNA (5-methylaminomethyl-2-thiouridine)(34)-methyltransferase MnmD/FAD-dependent 5-carboxymethylaminomethyl-2-thiouridine(34) oxidoreductase MnmC [Marinomonas colpomeniae]|uniref:tRNA 5-methylaminomethyl-2-thiouridine biosynthesis bifunctional protein MnmC n=1 Tax=Marinomonas colpomeniae TaxID=2774408 RepID=A0ABR8NUY8_9GAMM|nr:bifunctional tRNA (5-methylaminomethyl-2-thiouridine)(34)-methyltransferase MnmD/FAD-dependent 5-carboxymethylaminomethyl-2-thiouridine(34) oxidoreductase MnmC [Marinomonas colpomeniae]MBD5769868.1 bifunctional tRNA (5-methylaminomethyl-2-thiouridine)(34)-methyltransferase MnmD/FAD-dependent 5-carboxymethylaminomethyl-2-thiouridine(34) oxidoreductase MnmC [Marinomonas colpomeniae]
MLTSYKLERPDLNWGEDGAPHSSQFDDVYFDKESGLEETRYVFLQHNKLLERWKALQKNVFVIAETGFGTGLNFLCAWQAFLDSEASDDKQLHFISVEKYPLTKDMLTAALNMWPSLAAYSKELIEAYPTVCHGLHRIELAQGRIQLTLWFGEAEEGFAALNANIDAWFLDGFAPSKNPEMWTEKLFQHIHRLSHQGTTFSTFTAAGIVRRGLQAVGFDVQKVKGFGQKREMAVGQLNQLTTSFPERMSQGQAWFNLRQKISVPIKKVLVVGSGLAGANTAYALAAQGVSVTVWEQGKTIACEASGNPQGMLYPKFTAQDSEVNRFYLAAYLYATRLFSKLDQKQVFWDQCGLIQIPKNEKEALRFQKLLDEQLYPEAVLQASTDKNGSILLPLSGWVAPKKLCETLLSHPNISVQLNTLLSSLESIDPEITSESDESKNHWKATTGLQEHFFSHVVLCTANQTDNLNITTKTPTIPVRGQVSYLDVETARKNCLSQDEPAEKIDIEKVLCEFGYVSPPIDGQIHFGSTYNFEDDDQEVRESDHQKNLTILRGLLDLSDGVFESKDCSGRVSFRCTVVDHSPIVGPAQSDQIYQTAYSALTKNAKWKTNTIEEPISQLYINIGHGSRGLISTPLSGQYIASLITNTPSPLEQEISYSLHPSRFIIRNLKRSQGI